MKAVVVDTDVVSYGFKGDTRHEFYERELAGRAVAISFMTFAELMFWARTRNWGRRRRKELTRYLAQFAVINPDLTTCRVWADVVYECESQGHEISDSDAWIAAIALQHKVPLATHNEKHFRAINGLTLITQSRKT